MYVSAGSLRRARHQVKLQLNRAGLKRNIGIESSLDTYAQNEDGPRIGNGER